MTLILALFIFASAAGMANRFNPGHRAKFERTHRIWIKKTFPWAKEKP